MEEHEGAQMNLALKFLIGIFVQYTNSSSHRRSVKNKTGGAKACKIKLGGQRRKKVI